MVRRDRRVRSTRSRTAAIRHYSLTITSGSCFSLGVHGASQRSRRSVYLKKDLRTARPARVVAVPTGCRAYWIVRMGFGVALRLIEPAVLRTGCIARRTDLGKKPRRKLIRESPSLTATIGPGQEHHVHWKSRTASPFPPQGRPCNVDGGLAPATTHPGGILKVWQGEDPMTRRWHHRRSSTFTSGVAKS